MEEIQSNPLAAETEPERHILERIWQSRAERLARVPKDESAGEQLVLLVVRLGPEQYAVEAEFIYDIRPRGAVTPVPRVPAWVVGLSNMRGKILSVFDLRQYFKLPIRAGVSGEQNQGYQVLVQASGLELALLVDDVSAVVSIPAANIRAEPGFLSGVRPEYIRGTFQTGDRRNVTILNLPALLGDQRLIIEEQI